MAQHATVQSPCHQSWSKMTGSSTRRFCKHCENTSIGSTPSIPGSCNGWYEKTKVICVCVSTRHPNTHGPPNKNRLPPIIGYADQGSHWAWLLLHWAHPHRIT